MNISESSAVATSTFNTAHATPRQVDLFLCCNFSPADWERVMPQLAAHVHNLTGVIVSPYSMSKNGTFVYQDPGGL